MELFELGDSRYRGWTVTCEAAWAFLIGAGMELIEEVVFAVTVHVGPISMHFRFWHKDVPIFGDRTDHTPKKGKL